MVQDIISSSGACFMGRFWCWNEHYYGKKLEQRKIIVWIYTVVIVNTGWIFFRVTDMRQAMEVVKRLVLPWRYLSGSCSIWEFVSPMTVAVFILAVIGMGSVQTYKAHKHSAEENAGVMV